LAGIKDKARNTELVVFTEESIGSSYVDHDVEARVYPAFRYRDPASFEGIIENLQMVGGVDILHVQHEYGIYGRGYEIVDKVLEAKREGLARRVVFTLHTVYHPLNSESGELEFQDHVLSSADAVIVHSPQQEYELQAQLGGYPANLYRIPHGTAVNPYLGWSRAKIARALGLDKSLLEKFIVGFIGFLRPDKGIDTLLEAMEALETRSSLSVIVGGEIRDPSLLKLIEGYSREGVVLIPRYLSTEEILMLAALSDAIILPYRDPPGKYAVSGILHLSMGSLKPIIGSNVPRLSELYTLAPRLVFRAGDPWDLARLLKQFTSQAYFDWLVPYASPLYSYAVRTSWPRMASRHLRLYSRLLR
ncbi:MAG: glycosyltransferase, partial [Desulfurococcales archaeon]|nr:glycosyltransferase [Desulfurococcales archaeon]